MSTTTSSGGGATSANGNGKGSDLVLAGSDGGLALIPQNGALTRLNYYDGKFLRADDLRLEQDYLRHLVWLSNRAGGSGVVSGLDVRRAGGGTLEITAGLAIDPQGRVLSLPWAAQVDVQALIDASKQGASSGSASSGSGSGSGDAMPAFAPCDTSTAAPPPNGTALPSTDLYVIRAYHAEARCGEADVYGKLCEDACVTSSDRPYRLEGIVLRAVPLAVPPAGCTAGWLTTKHGRSRTASAFYAYERALSGADMSGARLKQELWCAGATAETGEFVPLAVVSVTGGTVQWVDEWIVRRERLADPALRYCQWLTGMRPLAVFWAQVLQFQCQLADAVSAPGTDTGPADDPCADKTALLKQAEALLADLEKRLQVAQGLAPAQTADDTAKLSGADPVGGKELFQPEYLVKMQGLHQSVTSLLQQQAAAPSRVLIDRGIVELPPAGYLPVAVGPVDVNTQVARLMGDGVDLRFCVVRPDYVGHAFEEAQHLERICLLEGLNDGARKPGVDVFVPDGVLAKPAPPPGMSFEVTLSAGVAADLSALDETQAQASDANGQQAPESGNLAGAPGAADTGTGTGGKGPLTLRAAGRGEPLQTGGAAFHLAGRATGKPISFDMQTPTDRKWSMNDLATRLDVFPVLATAFQPRDGGVVGHQGPPPPPPGQTGGGGTQTPAEEDVDAAVWATLRVDRDPFSLRPGDSTAVRLDLAAASPAESGHEPRAGTTAVTGELYCDQGGQGTGTFKGRLRNAWATSEATNDTKQKPPLPLKWGVELRQTAVSGGAGVTAKVELVPGTVVTVAVTWGGAPALANGTATLDLLGYVEHRLESFGISEAQARASLQPLAERVQGLDAVEFATARVRESQDVLRVDNRFHVLAVKALKQIEEALAEPGFRQAGEARLFPAPPPPAVPSVTATRDWVMFRRRRASSCDSCPPAAVAADRRYAVYFAPDRSPDNTLDVMRDVIAGKIPIPPGSEKFATRVGVVPVFRGDSVELATPAGDVLKAWKEVNPSGPLVYAAIMGSGAGAADVDALLSGRLDRLAQVLDPVSPSGGAVLDVVPQMADLFDEAGADGVIVLVTRAVETQHRVIEALGLGARTELDGFLGNGTVESDWSTRYALDLGFVVFQDDTPDAETLAAVKASATADLVKTANTLVYSRDTANPRHLAQAKQILAALGVTNLSDVQLKAVPLVGNEEIFGDAEALTITLKG